MATTKRQYEQGSEKLVKVQKRYTEPKLTAQQKRDREYMTATAALVATHEQELITACNQHFTLGLEQGYDEACYDLATMPWYKRLTYKVK